jgi:hypothetical protein
LHDVIPVFRREHAYRSKQPKVCPNAALHRYSRAHSECEAFELSSGATRDFHFDLRARGFAQELRFAHTKPP